MMRSVFLFVATLIIVLPLAAGAAPLAIASEEDPLANMCVIECKADCTYAANIGLTDCLQEPDHGSCYDNYVHYLQECKDGCPIYCAGHEEL